MDTKLIKEAKTLIGRLIEIKKDECPAVYEMYRNKKTKDAVIQIVLDYYLHDKVKDYSDAIGKVEIYYKQINYVD